MSLAPKVTVDEVRIDWTQPAIRIDRLVRGASPNPGRRPLSTSSGSRCCSPDRTSRASPCSLAACMPPNMRCSSAQATLNCAWTQSRPLKERHEWRHWRRGTKPESARFIDKGEVYPDRRRAARSGQPRRTIDPARRTAFEALRAVNGEGAYANLVLAALTAQHRLNERDAAFATELVFGTSRLQGSYDLVIERAGGRKLASLQPAVVDVLRLARPPDPGHARSRAGGRGRLSRPGRGGDRGARHWGRERHQPTDRGPHPGRLAGPTDQWVADCRGAGHSARSSALDRGCLRRAARRGRTGAGIAGKQHCADPDLGGPARLGHCRRTGPGRGHPHCLVAVGSDPGRQPVRRRGSARAPCRRAGRGQPTGVPRRDPRPRPRGPVAGPVCRPPAARPPC